MRVYRFRVHCAKVAMRSRFLANSAILTLALAGAFSISALAQTTDDGPGPSEQPSAPMEVGTPHPQGQTQQGQTQQTPPDQAAPDQAQQAPSQNPDSQPNQVQPSQVQPNQVQPGGARPNEARPNEAQPSDAQPS